MKGFEITEKKIPEFLLVFHMNLNGVKLVYISFIGEVKISQMFIHVISAPMHKFQSFYIELQFDMVSAHQE